MCRTLGRICMRIGIVLISIRIRNGIHVEIWIRVGIKTMPIHNTGNKYLRYSSCVSYTGQTNQICYSVSCCGVLNAFILPSAKPSRWRPVLLQTMLKQGHTWTGGVCTTTSPCWSPAPSAPRATHRSVGAPLLLQPLIYIDTVLPPPPNNKLQH